MLQMASDSEGLRLRLVPRPGEVQKGKLPPVWLPHHFCASTSSVPLSAIGPEQTALSFLKRKSSLNGYI